MPEVTVNNINFYFETHGVHEPIIFIHGFSVDHLVFASFPDYYQNDYKVVLIDNRGSGQSDCPDLPFTVEMMADDVIDICKALNLVPGHFVGHSLGGMILQHIAHKYPEQVRTATLCNTDRKIDIRYALAAKARLESIVKHCSPRSITEGALGWTFSSDFLSRPGMVEKLIQMRLSNQFPISAAGYKNQLNALFRFDSSLWVSKIKIPCLVISSEQDSIAPAINGKKMASLIKDAEYHCIPGAGHVPFIEKPEIFHPILKDFLRRHS